MHMIRTIYSGAEFAQRKIRNVESGIDTKTKKKGLKNVGRTNNEINHSKIVLHAFLAISCPTSS